MSLKNLTKIALLISFSLSLVASTGCSSFGRKFKAFLNGKSSSKTTGSRPISSKAAGVGGYRHQSFKNTPRFQTGPMRKYKRMTKEKLKEESQLTDRTGSLWVMEGQGAYLFSQNIIRMIGDSINVRIVGDPKQQLESKVSVIKRLLTKLKEARDRRNRRLASEAKKKEGVKAAKTKKKTAPKVPNGSKNQNSNGSKFAIRNVPTRIVERLVDGNYRIKGSQPFLIGNREYKAIVTGVVRAEDFSEDGIDANKLIDSKFDIVSVRKRSKNL